MNNDDRVVVWFSCGAASAVAASLAVKKYSWVKVVYCNTLASEHPDNLRFMHDVAKWIDHPIQIISSSKYLTVDDVFMQRRYMAGIKGAPCTLEMKKIPRLHYQDPGDIHIFGLTADEGSRIERFNQNNKDIDKEFILRDQGITKDDCYRILKEAGIELPAMYSLGFKNNNCLGCVKATSAVYWLRTRQHFPEVFAKRARQSREIGARLVRFHGVRMFLDELPPDAENDGKAEEDIECGVTCVQEELNLSKPVEEK